MEINHAIEVKTGVYIDNIKDVQERLSQQAGESVLMTEVIEYIRGKKNAMAFISKRLHVSREVGDDPLYVWMETGVMSTTGNPLFISAVYRPQEQIFCGHYVGEIKNLAAVLVHYLHIPNYCATFAKLKNKVSAILWADGECQQEPCMPITKQVFDRLLINNWCEQRGLDVFLKIIGSRILALEETGQTQYLIQNHLRDTVVNTGLLDTYKNDIYVLYRYYVGKGYFLPEAIVPNKAMLLEREFSREQTNLSAILPIQFMDDSPYIGNIKEDDFDISHEALHHIIRENRERLGETAQEMPDGMLADKIRSALSLGIKMLQRDKAYCKPVYSASERRISWLLPLHISREITEEPEAVIVIRANKGYFEVRTVLPYDASVKDRITALSLYGKSW